MNTQRVLATFLVAVLAASVYTLVATPFTLRQANAQAVTIETSADDNGGSFFGEGVLQVVVTDPSADDDDTQETITVNIDATPGSGQGGSGSFEVPETSASSGRFEFFLMHADANEVDFNPSVLTGAELDAINTNGADDYPASVAANAPSIPAPVIQFGPSGSADEDLLVPGLDPLATSWEDVSFDITVGNVEITVDYDEMDGELTLDRETAYGTNSTMHTFIFDNDANLNPTGPDGFLVSSTNLNNDGSGALELFTISGGSFVDQVFFNETGDNTGLFEALVRLSNVASSNTQEFVYTTEGVQLTLNDKAEYTAITGSNNDSTATSSVSFEIDNVDGEFDDVAALTFGSELKLVLRDSDRNLDSESDESIEDNSATTAVEGVVVFVSGGDSEELVMEETGDNTGVFEIDLSNGELRITFLGSGQTATNDNGILELTANDITEDITVRYRDPVNETAGVSVTSEITLEMTLQNGNVDLPETTGINDDFTLTITDADLNDNPRTRDSYTFTLTGDGGTNGVFELFRGSNNLTDLATLEIEAEGEAVNFGSDSFSYTLTETGINTGIFTVDIDMQDIAQNGGENSNGVGGNPIDLDDGDEIEVTYNDLMDDTTRESSDEVSIGKASAGVDFSRSTLPVPPAPSTGTSVRVGGQSSSTIGATVFTTLMITDPDENEISTAEDTIPFTLGTGNSAFTIEIETDAGSIEIVSNTNYTSLNIPGTSVQLQDILPSLPSLSETGRQTGVFEEELQFRDVSGIDDDDWHNMEFTVTYQDADGDEESAGVTFRGNDGALTVDQNSAKAGTVITITIEDQDLNLDDGEIEEFEGSTAPSGDFLLSVEAEDDDMTGESTETFRETGPDTGIFTAEYEVGTDIPITDLPTGGDEVDQASNILITYDDEVDSTGNSGEEIEVNVPVVTSTGSIQVTPELVGPGTEITVLIVDADLDQDSSGTDDYSSTDPNGDDFFVSFRSDRSEVGDASPDLDETGPNTGVFEFTIELVTDEGACEDDDLSASTYEAEGGSEPEIGACPGDLISIRYEDQQDASGRSTTVSQVIEVRSWDPEFVADKEGYAVGDRVTITISDPDANRDPDIADSLTDIRVFSTSDAVGEELSALETGRDTGVFRLSFQASDDTASGAITVRQGDRVTIEYTDEFPADFEDEEEDKEFQFNVNIAGRTGVDATTVSEPGLRDVTGQTLSSLSVGQQAVLSTTVVNNNDEPRPFVALVEVRDSSGITVYLAWQTGTLNPGGQTEVGLSWTPEEAGDYEVRTFVISDLANPQILSTVAQSDISVSG